jgi:hypothetical protein
MKLKILFSVILLSAISQLSSSNMTYFQNRINFGHNYRSQCASLLCSGSNNNWFDNGWDDCVSNYIPFEQARLAPHSVEDVNKMQLRYFERDCSAIGGRVEFAGEREIGRGATKEAYKCVPTNPSGRFIVSACGFKQNW